MVGKVSSTIVLITLISLSVESRGVSAASHKIDIA